MGTMKIIDSIRTSTCEALQSGRLVRSATFVRRSEARDVAAAQRVAVCAAWRARSALRRGFHLSAAREAEVASTAAREVALACKVARVG
jgi:hypothetical protein